MESIVAPLVKTGEENSNPLHGFPILGWHPNFDVVKGMVTDYLHCVLLGVTKTLLNSWLDPKNSSFDFYI